MRGLADGAGTVVMVGHNPGVEELAELLTGEWVRMPTSALAVLAVAAWSGAGDGSAVLRASGRPPA